MLLYYNSLVQPMLLYWHKQHGSIIILYIFTTESYFIFMMMEINRHCFNQSLQLDEALPFQHHGAHLFLTMAASCRRLKQYMRLRFPSRKDWLPRCGLQLFMTTPTVCPISSVSATMSHLLMPCFLHTVTANGWDGRTEAQIFQPDRAQYEKQLSF